MVHVKTIFNTFNKEVFERVVCKKEDISYFEQEQVVF